RPARHRSHTPRHPRRRVGKALTPLLPPPTKRQWRHRSVGERQPRPRWARHRGAHRAGRVGLHHHPLNQSRAPRRRRRTPRHRYTEGPVRLIVTHEQPDFDALASVALALELYPGSRATVQGALQPALQAFLRLYRDQLDLLEADRIDLDAVGELVVVDTADRTRIR